MSLTKLEKHLLLKMSFTILKWVACTVLIVYAIYRLFLGAVLIALVWLLLTSFACCENGYIPRYHYFLRYRFRHSYEERIALSNQYESFQCIRIGEGVFLEDYLLFADFGAIFLYSEIKNISYKKNSNLNVVSVVLTNGKKYNFNISEPEYKGAQSLYNRALAYFQSKK